LEDVTSGSGAEAPALLRFLGFAPGVESFFDTVSTLRLSAETDHPGTANMVAIIELGVVILFFSIEASL
jgi:hypothetical protein